MLKFERTVFVYKTRRHARVRGICEGYVGDSWRKFGGHLDELWRTIVGNVKEIKRRLEVNNLVVKTLIFEYPC